MTNQGCGYGRFPSAGDPMVDPRDRVVEAARRYLIAVWADAGSGREVWFPDTYADENTVRERYWAVAHENPAKPLQLFEKLAAAYPGWVAVVANGGELRPVTVAWRTVPAVTAQEIVGTQPLQKVDAPPPFNPDPRLIGHMEHGQASPDGDR